MNWDGLAAEFADLFGGDEPGADYDYFRQVIRQNGEPALDVGCGTGRLLVRYLRAGLQVEGVDSAADSLMVCRRKGEAHGLAPVLYQQCMQNLRSPRRYRTIFVPCGSFHLVSDRDEAQEALSRFHDHLEVGGKLVLTLQEPSWDDMSDEGVKRRPGPRWVLGGATRPSDGARLVIRWMKESIDRVEQVLVNQRRYEVWLGDRLVQEECRTMPLRWYYRHEMRLMLENAGFKAICATGDYTDVELSAQHALWVFTAWK